MLHQLHYSDNVWLMEAEARDPLWIVSVKMHGWMDGCKKQLHIEFHIEAFGKNARNVDPGKTQVVSVYVQGDLKEMNAPAPEINVEQLV